MSIEAWIVVLVALFAAVVIAVTVGFIQLWHSVYPYGQRNHYKKEWNE